LVADLQGRVPIKVDIESAIIGGRQVKATVANVPDLPIGSFSLGLDGGMNGVLLNKSNLCFRSDSSSRFRDLRAAVSFTGHNGATINSTPRIGEEGCGPGLSVSVRGARGAKPSLRATIRAHPDAAKIERLDLVLPRDLSLVRGKLRVGASGQAANALAGGDFALAGRRTLTVKGLSKRPASLVSVRLRWVAVRALKQLRKALRKHRRRALRFKLVATGANGGELTARTTVLVRR